MTQFALRASRSANGVSLRHGGVSREMWRSIWPSREVDDVPIGHVTNGVHVPSWVGAPVRRLLDIHLGEGWPLRAGDASTIAAIDAIDGAQLWAARCAQRRLLVEFVRDRSQLQRIARGEPRERVEAAAKAFDPGVLTVGFARRVATYKRLDVLLHDVQRSFDLLGGERPIQLLVAGKAHPRDDDGKRLLQKLFYLRSERRAFERVVFLEDYDLGVASLLVRGCDVWVNVPRPPLEASGTSGMKSAVNGGLQLSVLDGWWAEGYDGSNGWALDGSIDDDHAAQDARHAGELYRLLEDEIVPEFYDRDEAGLPQAWIERVKRSMRDADPRVLGDADGVGVRAAHLPRALSAARPRAYHGAMDSAEALSDAVLAIAAEHAVEPVLQKLVDAARELAGARYAAIGVPDGDGGFGAVHHRGHERRADRERSARCRERTACSARCSSPTVRRSARQTSARTRAFAAGGRTTHPSMSSFLGVPIVARGKVAGAFYLTDKEGADTFSDDDQALIETFAAHAALAIENARLHERSRELSIVEERNRLARELHDAVTQKLFGVVLAAESGTALLARDLDAAGAQLELVRELAGEAMEELRSVIVHLRPPALEDEGLAVALAKHVDVLRRAHRRAIELDVSGECVVPERIETDVFRIAQEALNNALRHAGAARIELRLRCADESLDLAIADDGVGFDPGAARSRRLGLTTMAERAAAIGGALEIESAPGAGTTVRLAVRP